MDDVVKSLSARMAEASRRQVRRTPEPGRSRGRRSHSDPLGRRRSAREGLRDTPGACRQGLRGVLRRLRRGPARMFSTGFSRKSRLRRHRPRARHPVLLPLRAPHGALLRRWRISPITRPRAWSACPSSPGSSTSLPAGCRRRRAMTAQIVEAMDEALQPRGVAVMLEAEHMCMSMRGIQKAGARRSPPSSPASFKDDPAEQMRFLTLVAARQA